jgi:hypothetical protein
MSFPVISLPNLSPSLNEYDLPTFTDQHGNVVPIFGVVTPDASGNTTLPTGSGVVIPITKSQVTSKRQAPQVGVNKIPVVGLMGVDPTSGAPIPFVASSATVATFVSGKFQSAVETGTGLAQNLAHGLGAIPSMVLVAPYDNTASGLTPFTFTITEGVHTTTNVVITATAGLKYKVIAFL